MKGGFRQSMAWLHTWAGLVLGWLLFFIFATGTAGYFDDEIDLWMQPELPPARVAPAAEATALALARLQAVAPGARQWWITLPTTRDAPHLGIFWQGSPGGRERLDAATGTPLQARATGGGQWLYQLHWRLHYLPEQASVWLVAVATMFMLVAIVTGVVVHKKFFADFFTFRPRKGQRSWLDAHNVLSVAALPFHVMITYSGLVFYMFTTLPLAGAAHHGLDDAARQAMLNAMFRISAPLPASGQAAPLAGLAPLLAQAEARWGAGAAHLVVINHPGDAHARIRLYRWGGTPLRRSEELVFDGVSGALLQERPAVLSAPMTVRDVLLGLHEGLFAGPWLRWLYFLSGLLGTAMVGTGLVLWTVKRAQKQAGRQRSAQHRGLALVERLNVGTVAGLPVAMAAYFWANRLLPLGMADRAAWEAHALFIAWAAMLLHAALRPVRRAWVEQWWCAAAAFGLLPVLNALTTGRHLGVSLPQGDWVLAGFDLTVLGLGAACAAVAWRLHCRWRRGG